jgi:hypothetical protein
MTLDALILILTPAFIVGLFLITQSCTDFTLQREIFGFNWRARQWQVLNYPRSFGLNMLRFAFGCLIIAIAPWLLLWIAVWIAWFVGELVLGYQPKSKRQPNYD